MLIGLVYPMAWAWLLLSLLLEEVRRRLFLNLNSLP